MEKEINTFLIRIAGKAFVNTTAIVWELGDEVEIVVKGGIIKKEELDNQDGTKDVVWVIKPTEVEIKQ